MPSLASQFLKRVCGILDTENVQYDKAVVAEVVRRYLPDWRRVLNELQRYSAVGRIDSGILSNFQEVSLKMVVQYIKAKDYTSVRKWVGENADIDVHTIYRDLYDCASQYVKKESIPMLVLLVGKYQYQSAFAVDQEINLCCCLTELMVECEFV